LNNIAVRFGQRAKVRGNGRRRRGYIPLVTPVVIAVPKGKRLGTAQGQGIIALKERCYFTFDPVLGVADKRTPMRVELA